MKKFASMLLVMVMVLGLCACGAKEEAPAPADNAVKVYAVEAGSAGEAVALENGWEVVSVDTQSKALMEVASGTSDAAIIDLLMAGAMIGEGTSYPDMKLGDKLTTEEYGAGCRKGSDLTDKINAAIVTLSENGTLAALAEKYGLTNDLIPNIGK